jgi:hypothetical protein
MIMDMGTLRITEAELARDIHAVLAKVQQGAEIVVEQDHRLVAVIRSPYAGTSQSRQWWSRFGRTQP